MQTSDNAANTPPDNRMVTEITKKMVGLERADVVNPGLTGHAMQDLSINSGERSVVGALFERHAIRNLSLECAPKRTSAGPLRTYEVTP
jgi:hypothetical protein